MSHDLSRAFDVALRVMDYTSARARALNTNLAHASEPGYRRVDVDFAALVRALREEDEARRAKALAQATPKTAVDADAPASADGNTVNFEKEQIQSDKNGLLHQLATTMVSTTLQQLRAAITGRP